MRRQGTAVLLLLIALTLAGCTDSSEPSATSTAAGESSGVGDPTSTSEPTGADSSLTQVEAQAALDDALAAIDDRGSIGFTSRGQNVINDDVTKISSSGAWTRNPLAWTTTTTIDRPKVIINSVSVDVEIIDQIYVESTPSGPYVRTTYPDLSKRSQPIPWMQIPGYGVREGVTSEDIRTPLDLLMLLQTQASAGSALGDTTTISGTIPTASALSTLDLTSHLGDLGFANRFEDSTTRVLVTIGADGLPQTLEFAGTNISLAGAGLPDYVIEELSQARYFVEYGEANLDGPIKVPTKAAN